MPAQRSEPLTAPARRPDELLHAYQRHPDVARFAQALHNVDGGRFRITGIAGSQLAFLAASLWRDAQRSMVFIFNDREEALYFQNDLEQLLPRKEIFLFPASYKRPYQVEEVDNANVLQRAEVLNELNHTRTGRQILVTFAEALNEKVINKRSLVKNTLDLRQNESPGMEFVMDVLEEYGFEREDFAFEPGQYAVRGGIIDVYSFAHPLPYRIQFFGDEIEQISEFDPVSQLTTATHTHISVIPNIQKNLLLEEKVSLFEYISPKTVIFTKNIDFIRTDLDRLYDKAAASYAELQHKSRGAATSLGPEYLFWSGKSFLEELGGFATVEFGMTPYFPKHQHTLEWKGSAQPQFRKEFKLLASHLAENVHQGIANYLFTTNQKQIQRLHEIFDEIAPGTRFEGIGADIHEGFLDPMLGIACYTDHQIFERYHRYRMRASRERSQAITLRELRELNPGDFVTHITHGIGKFAGLHTIKVGEHLQEAIKILYKDGDAIFVNVNALHKVSKFVGQDGTEPQLSKIGSGAWAKAKAKAKKRVKELAFDLVNLYAKRRLAKGTAFEPDEYMQRELEASFMYEDTPDQLKSTEDVKADMERPFPMDRLVCGDVGFGKTEVAIRAAFKAAVNGKQVCILAPTTILALQHYKTFSERLKEFPVKVDYLNRFKSEKDIKQTLEKLSQGQVDILIGTHRIVSDDVKFKDLGLVIIDEEQRFGVNVKDKLKVLRTQVHTLTLTATPIPRTLQFSLLGIRDLSVIATPPPNRQPVETIVVNGFREEVVRDAVSYELKRGGQVYFIHPRVMDIEEVAALIKKLVPDARIGIAHGQMTGPKLEQAMADFIEGAFDVLVATKIVESGLDIPNANTILINQANMYGLAELHQMRGRVGRSNRKAFCYLLAPPDISLTEDARKRLKAMVEFTDLGSGFHIALRDLDIRGAGDLLGPEQSGFISEIGYDIYQKILDEAIRELKQEHFGELFEQEIRQREAIFVEDCQLDLDLDIRIPESYLPSVSERLMFYRRISGAEKEEERATVLREMADRFGKPVPAPVLNLMECTRIRQVAIHVGLEKISLKQGTLRFFFVSDSQSLFYKSRQFERLIEFVQTYSGRVAIKESDKYLSLTFKDPVTQIQRVLQLVEEMHEFLAAAPAQP